MKSPATLMLSLLLLLIIAGQCSPAPNHRQSDPHAQRSRKARYALQDEVNLVSYGLLQLGSTFKHYVDRLTVQVNDAFQKIQAQGSAYTRLEQETTQLKEAEQKLKEKTAELESSNMELRVESAKLGHRVEWLSEEELVLKKKVHELEARLVNRSGELQSSDLAVIKSFFDGQNKNISNLLQTVSDQNERLQQQSMKIQGLEEKVEATKARVNKFRRGSRERIARRYYPRTSGEVAVAENDSTAVP
ncbi:angiopoietin-related protein 3-like [Lampetra fluviatilis]